MTLTPDQTAELVGAHRDAPPQALIALLGYRHPAGHVDLFQQGDGRFAGRFDPPETAALADRVKSSEQSEAGTELSLARGAAILGRLIDQIDEHYPHTDSTAVDDARRFLTAPAVVAAIESFEPGPHRRGDDYVPEPELVGLDDRIADDELVLDEDELVLDRALAESELEERADDA